MAYVTINQTSRGWNVKKMSKTGKQISKKNFRLKSRAKKYAKSLREKIYHAY